MYERDLTRFLEDAYLRVGGTAATVAASVASQELLSTAGGGKRTPKISTAGGGGGGVSGGVTQLLGSDKDTWGTTENSLTDRER